MTFDANAPSVYVRCNWPGRREDPQAVAGRLRRFFDGIGVLDPALAAWSIGQDHRVPYSSVRDHLAAFVAREVVIGESGEEQPKVGYSIVGSSEDRRQRYSMVACVGGIYGWPMWNRIYFFTSNGAPPDPTIVTYDVIKGVILAAIACWEPTFCTARLSELALDEANEGWFTKAWMTYVSPAHAASVDLVGIPFSEWTPDGAFCCLPRISSLTPEIRSMWTAPGEFRRRRNISMRRFRLFKGPTRQLAGPCH